MKHITRYIALIIILAASAVESHALKPTISATIDSAVMMMGNKTAIHLEIVKDANANGSLGAIPDMIMQGVETSAVTDPDSSDLGSNRHSIRQDVIVQSFDSGLYMLPPFVYIENGETIRSNQVVLKVMPVDVDTLQTIHDYAGVVDVEREWLDYMPDWVADYWLWIVLAILLAAVVAAAVYLYRKNGGLKLKPKKVEPPYEVAVKALNTLKSENLCEQGLEREYYTRLTEILRVYLDSRFGINAMEMTSQQILDALNDNEKTRVPKRYMSQILETADFVKFAKVRPLPDDNVQAFNSALNFVEETKPAPVEEEEEEDTDSENAPKQPDDKSTIKK